MMFGSNKSKRLTVAALIKAGMPSWDIAKFHIQWPYGCEITPANYQRAEKIGLTPEVLFAAVCPNKAALDAFNEAGWATCQTERRAIEDECKARIAKLESDHTAAMLQRKCDLLIEAMKDELV